MTWYPSFPLYIEGVDRGRGYGDIGGGKLGERGRGAGVEGAGRGGGAAGAGSL